MLISICIYIESGSTCQEAAILCHNVSTVGQNVDLLRISGFYADITAGLKNMWDENRD